MSIEFSLEQSLHLTTQLASPRPPFNGWDSENCQSSENDSIVDGQIFNWASLANLSQNNNTQRYKIQKDFLSEKNEIIAPSQSRKFN